jgi:hypothetical protein
MQVAEQDVEPAQGAGSWCELQMGEEVIEELVAAVEKVRKIQHE